ncbi:hypothetical protein JCM10212_002575 [Sporobolomyces blumeae]
MTQSTAASDEASTSKGPSTMPKSSCETCRLRRVKCVRPTDLDASCQACAKKGIRCVVVERPRTRNRSGKNVETARARYGSASREPSRSHSSSSSGSASPQVVPSPQLVVQAKLAQDELAGQFGNRLFELWLDQDRVQERERWPSVDLPVVDFCALRARYNASGFRLEHLETSDQLLTRLVFAFSAPAHLPPHLSHHSRLSISSQLLSEAESLSDALAIWRKPSASHAASLVLFHKALSASSIDNPDARTYLSAAAEQLRRLASSDPAAVCGELGPGSSGLSWSTALVDAVAAAERRTVPHLTRADLETYLGRTEPSLPSLDSVLAVFPLSPELTMAKILDVLFYFIVLARDVAKWTSSAKTGDATGLSMLSTRLDGLYDWSQGALILCSANEGVSSGLCRVYTSVIWASAVMLEFSLAEHLSSLVTRAASDASASFDLSSTERLSSLVASCQCARSRIVAVGTRLVDHMSRTGEIYALGILPGVGCSASRVIDLVKAILAAPASETTRFGNPPSVRLESLEWLSPQVARIAGAWPSVRATETLEAIEHEMDKLKVDMQARGDAQDLTSFQNSAFDPADFATSYSTSFAANSPGRVALNTGHISSASLETSLSLGLGSLSSSSSASTSTFDLPDLPATTVTELASGSVQPGLPAGVALDVGWESLLADVGFAAAGEGSNGYWTEWADIESM